MINERGFTFIEIIVALAIVAAVGTVISMTTSFVLLNYNQPSTKQILLNQVQSAGYRITHDIQMSSELTFNEVSGFPVSITIPVDQDTNNDYRVDYIIDGDKFKRREYDSSDILVTELVVSQYVNPQNSSFENPSAGFYKFTFETFLDDKTVTASYEARQRLTQK